MVSLALLVQHVEEALTDKMNTLAVVTVLKGLPTDALSLIIFLENCWHNHTLKYQNRRYISHKYFPYLLNCEDLPVYVTLELLVAVVDAQLLKTVCV